mmetsp:Transcript_11729/g.28906  ORF Transcript_11729/g.28906 Transcript_11729/m.28906 type:complete len:87 (+) Transcript_11729:1556-1816(+)
MPNTTVTMKLYGWYWLSVSMSLLDLFPTPMTTVVLLSLAHGASKSSPSSPQVEENPFAVLLIRLAIGTRKDHLEQGEGGEESVCVG